MVILVFFYFILLFFSLPPENVTKNETCDLNNHLDTVRPVTGRVVHHAQGVHGVHGVRFGIRHEQRGLL